LIELLVVIAIIGILSAIGLVALNGAREKARDAQRRSDIAQTRTALTLYFDDNSSKYPVTVAGSGTPDVSAYGTTAATALGVWASGGALVTGYLAQELKAPGSELDHAYKYDSASTARLEYYLYTDLEAGVGTHVYAINEDGTVTDYADNMTTEPNCAVGACTAPAA